MPSSGPPPSLPSIRSSNRWVGTLRTSRCLLPVRKLPSHTAARGREPFETLVELQQQGLIRHLGVSNATADQVAEAQAIAHSPMRSGRSRRPG
ncbi:aldo/keto reductase [Nonomuraea cavernae]|uniref:aldo/keto reductase n=1 Tax=Nonomuraea cavernae TaxID=2045107 RepID=UPI0033DD5E48